jgi:hypothetical protein
MGFQDQLPCIWQYVQFLSFDAYILIRLVTALAEILGKIVMGHGVAASFRPHRYYKVPKETLETFLDDIEQLINFFVIEFQRILFAENPAATVAVRALQAKRAVIEGVADCFISRHSFRLSSRTT